MIFLNHKKMLKQEFDNMETLDEENQITLMAVGDIMLGNRFICMKHGISTMRRKNPKYPFLHTASTLRKGDIVFGNLEAVLSTKNMNINSIKTLQLRGMPSAIEGVTYAGFNVLSLANNHVMEHGKEAMFETKSILSAHNIKYIGVDKNIKKDRKPAIIKIKNIKIAFLAYCLVHDKTSFCPISNPSDICTDVKKAKTQADIVIVSLHWGNEFIERPSPFQIKLGRKIIDSGANIILGHHPHVLQGIETYNGGRIAYSLGNFVFDQWQEKTRESMIFYCKLSKNGIISTETLPVYINDKYQPEILEGIKAKKLLSKINDLSSRLMSEDLSNFDKKTKEYMAEVKFHRNQYRKDLRKYFLMNIYRYPPRFTFQIVKEHIVKKIIEIISRHK